MTYILLNLEGFRESNAIANYVLSRFGFRGMVYFKFALVAFVAVAAQIAALKHIRIGRWLLNFGTLITGCVVIYSFYLLLLWIGQKRRHSHGDSNLYCPKPDWFGTQALSRGLILFFGILDPFSKRLPT